jgi:DNA-binding transcriptional ArsR family regulator
MESADAVQSLSALAHEGRLSVFRELVKAGPDGLAAGEVARRVGVLPNTLSASLAILAHAGLVASRREGRSVVYSATYARMAELLGFLVQDCCQGSAAVCAPLTQLAAGAACRPAEPA